MSAQPLAHRNVHITLNLQPTVDIMLNHMVRLVEQAKALYTGPNDLSKTVQKRWYGKQLVKNGLTYGYIYFTVTNRDILKREFDLSDDLATAKDLEFTFHVKQIETPMVAANFTSGSLRYKARWGELNKQRVMFNLYGGTDVESAILFRDLIADIGQQLSDFNLDSTTTLIAQNELDLQQIHTF